jgi:hypothetical protein
MFLPTVGASGIPDVTTPYVRLTFIIVIVAGKTTHTYFV